MFHSACWPDNLCRVVRSAVSKPGRIAASAATTQVAVASSCDEPSWARECLTKFTVGNGTPLSEIVAPNLIEIYKASSKQVHLKAISKASGVPLSEMMFLDKLRGHRAICAQRAHCAHCFANFLCDRWPLFAASVGTAPWWRSSELQSFTHPMV